MSINHTQMSAKLHKPRLLMERLQYIINCTQMRQIVNCVLPADESTSIVSMILDSKLESILPSHKDDLEDGREKLSISERRRFGCHRGI